MENDIKIENERLPEITSKDIERNEDGLFKCRFEGCEKGFKQARSVYNHENMYHNPSGLSCPICERKLKNRDTLRKHMAIHVDVSKRETFSCPHENCSRYYYHKKNLTEHIRIAHGEKLFICPHPGCGRSMANKVALNYHLSVHERRQNKEDDEFTPELVCDICSRGFKIKDNLEKHILEHQQLSEISEEKIIKSEVLNGDTLNHKVTPTPDSEHSLDSSESSGKSFTCHKCKRVFREMSKLRRHFLVHKDPLKRKRFVCPHKNCTRSYTTKWNLSYHIKDAHESGGRKESYENKGRFPLHIAASNRKKQMRERNKNLFSMMNIKVKKLQNKEKNFRIEENLRVRKSNKKRRKKLEKNSENEPPVNEKERINESAETDFTSVLEMESVQLRESFQYWLQKEGKSSKQIAKKTIDISVVNYKEEEEPSVKLEENFPSDSNESDCEGFSVVGDENASYFDVMKNYTEKVSKLETEVIALTAREYYKGNNLRGVASTFNTDINKWLRMMLFVMEDMYPDATNANTIDSTLSEVD